MYIFFKVDSHYTIEMKQCIRDKWDMKRVFSRLLQSKHELILPNNNFKQIIVTDIWNILAPRVKILLKNKPLCFLLRKFIRN